MMKTETSDNVRTALIALSSDGALSNFMSQSQRLALVFALSGEEAEGIAETVVDLVQRIADMPVTYETEGQGDNAIVHLHYFKGAFNWYVIEKDKGDLNDAQQIQAYGLSDMGEQEMGYISIQAMIELGVELDLYWTPKRVKECRK
jgi:hypothetical protein